MNFYKHHIGDYAQATAHLTFTEDAAYSRLLRKYYAEEKPIPPDLKAAQRLVGARTREEKDAVETVLGEFFTLEEDGWHNKRADGEIAEARTLEEERDSRRANEAERQRRHRERRKELFEQLREHGIVPKFETKTEALEAMLSRVTVVGGNGDSNVTDGDLSRVTVGGCHALATANQTPDARHQSSTPDTSLRAEGSRTARSLADAPGDDPPPPPAPTSTAAGRACLAMRRGGLIRTNPADPRLIAACALPGATDAMWEATAREAVEAQPPKGVAWVIATVTGRIADAAAATTSANTGATHASSARNGRGERRSLADAVVGTAHHHAQHHDDRDVLEGTATRIAD